MLPDFGQQKTRPLKGRANISRGTTLLFRRNSYQLSTVNMKPTNRIAGTARRLLTVSSRRALTLQIYLSVQAGRSGASSEGLRHRLAPTAGSLGRTVPTTPLHCGFREIFN